MTDRQRLFTEHSERWTEHFQQNRNHMDHVPWEDDSYELSESERNAISKSIAVFQLGENSEGNSFFRAGREYAKQSGDQEYLNSLQLFIKEEQSHSAALGRFMDSQGIHRIEKEWTDTSFRFLRKLSGLNICISVLLTAEIIASVYYRALGQATASPILRAICGQILIDEAHHLRFQAATLAKTRIQWPPLKRWLFRQFQRVLLAGTIIIVWKEHRSVYRAGRFGFLQWCSMTWAQLEEVLLITRRGIESDHCNLDLPLPADTPLTMTPHLPARNFPSSAVVH